MTISDQFSGLQLEHLIGSPLKAAADAQAEAAKATADFIKKVGVPPVALTPVPAFIMHETTGDFPAEVKEKLPPED